MPSNARSVNSTILTGRLVRDAEFVDKDGRGDYVGFRLCWRNYIGGRIVGSVYMDVRAYKFQIDNCRDLKQGDEVRVVGELRSFQEDDHNYYFIVCANLWPLKVAGEEEGDEEGAASAADLVLS